MIEIETRQSFLNTNFRTELVDEKLYLEGYFIRFNEETELWPDVYEEVLPESVKESINNDIRCLFNHDTGSVLGRTSNNTLKLTVDDKGVFGSVEVNQEDPEAMSVYSKVKRGDIDACSFGFNVRKEEIEDRDDGTTKFVLKDIDLHEVSIVTFPAYPTTAIAARNKDIELDKRRKLEIKKKEAREKIHGIKTIDFK